MLVFLLQAEEGPMSWESMGSRAFFGIPQGKLFFLSIFKY